MSPMGTFSPDFPSPWMNGRMEKSTYRGHRESPWLLLSKTMDFWLNQNTPIYHDVTEAIGVPTSVQSRAQNVWILLFTVGRSCPDVKFKKSNV